MKRTKNFFFCHRLQSGIQRMGDNVRYKKIVGWGTHTREVSIAGYFLALLFLHNHIFSRGSFSHYLSIKKAGNHRKTETWRTSVQCFFWKVLVIVLFKISGLLFYFRLFAKNIPLLLYSWTFYDPTFYWTHYAATENCIIWMLVCVCGYCSANTGEVFRNC